MSKTAKGARKIGVALIGFPLLVVGVILIPLPGPGLLVMLLALVILSTEFEWADHYKKQARAKLQSIYQASKNKADKIADQADQDTKDKQKKTR